MRKYFLLLITLFLFEVSSFAQDDAAWKYAETITQQDLRKQLTIVASAEMEGRETGTEGQRKAAAYIETQFKEIGLKFPEVLKGYQQYYPLFKDTLIPKSFKIGNDELVYGKDYILTPGSSKEDELKATEIVFAGYGIEDKNYDDYAGKNVKGKVVLIVNGEPKVDGRFLVSGSDRPSRWGFSTTMKAVLAKEKGIAESSRKTNVYFPHLNEKEKLTVATLTISQLKNIFGEKEAGEIAGKVKVKDALNEILLNKKIKVKLDFKKISVELSASNVIGYIEGTG